MTDLYDYHNGPNLGLEPCGGQPMNDNNIKLPPLPEWMSNYTIPADGFECDKNVMLVDRMHAYARAAVLADRQQRGGDVTDDMRAALAAQPAASAEPKKAVTVSQLETLFESEDVDRQQTGYYWRKGWNAAIRRCMDIAYPMYAAPVTAKAPADDIAEKLKDPNVVHVNMLRGTIAPITFDQLAHVLGDDAKREWLAKQAPAADGDAQPVAQQRTNGDHHE